MYVDIREKEKEQIILEIIGKRPEMKEESMQTESDTKAKQIDQLTREKKMIMN